LRWAGRRKRRSVTHAGHDAALSWSRRASRRATTPHVRGNVDAHRVGNDSGAVVEALPEELTKATCFSGEFYTSTKFIGRHGLSF
jgi:hypothetical protein